MCTNEVSEDAAELLAELLRDMAQAIEPDHPEDVLIGPVDFGSHDG